MRTYLRIVILIPLLYLLSISCEDLLNDLLTFESNNYTIDFAIEPLDKTGYHIFAEETSESDIDSLLDANSVSRDRLTEVHIKEASVEILHPDASINFDLLENLSLTIYTKTLGEKTIASLDPVPDGLTEFTLDLMEEDIKEYLYESEFILSAVGVLSERTNDTIPVQATVKFEFNAGLSK